MLDHGPDQGRRAITLLPDLPVCLVRESQVVPDVADALALLDPLRPQTWVSGTFATSDVELSRVEGVHGPRRRTASSSPTEREAGVVRVRPQASRSRPLGSLVRRQDLGQM